MLVRSSGFSHGLLFLFWDNAKAHTSTQYMTFGGKGFPNAEDFDPPSFVSSKTRSSKAFCCIVLFITVGSFVLTAKTVCRVRNLFLT